METPIIIKNLTKKFGNVIAVNNVSLTIEPRTFLTLLGPSGCGKTTLLRCISGLEDPNEGEIYIGCAGGKGTKAYFKYKPKDAPKKYFWFNSF